MTSEPVWFVYSCVPTLAPSIVFFSLFGALTLVSVLQFSRVLKNLSTWNERGRVCWQIPFILGGVFEIVGFHFRVMSHHDPSSLKSYLYQLLFIWQAPGLVSASIYMVAGRVIGELDNKHISLVPRFAKVFVLVHFLCISMEGGVVGEVHGQGFQSRAIDIGLKLITVSLIAQIVCHSLFLIITALNFYKMVATPTPTAVVNWNMPSRFRNWRTVICGLMFSSVLILLRTIFRTVELLLGTQTTIMSHEAFHYVFDSLLVFVSMVVFMCFDTGSFHANSVDVDDNQPLDPTEFYRREVKETYHESY